MALYKRIAGIKGACLRLANPYGAGQSGRSRQGIVGVAFQKVLAAEPLPLWGTLDTCKDFLYVEDAVDAFLSVLFCHPFPEGIFHVGSGRGTTLDEVLTLVEKISGKRLIRQTMATKPSDTPWVVLDSDKIRRATGWRAMTSLEEGMRRTWEDMLQADRRKVA